MPCVRRLPNNAWVSSHKAAVPRDSGRIWEPPVLRCAQEAAAPRAQLEPLNATACNRKPAMPPVLGKTLVPPVPISARTLQGPASARANRPRSGATACNRKSALRPVLGRMAELPPASSYAVAASALVYASRGRSNAAVFSPNLATPGVHGKMSAAPVPACATTSPRLVWARANRATKIAPDLNHRPATRPVLGRAPDLPLAPPMLASAEPARGLACRTP
jgi:hypothetical protein